MSGISDEAVLSEFEGVVEQLVHRHLRSSRDWYPHELVPWNRGCDSSRDDPWDEHDYPLALGVRSALLVNLLTEENLPYYYSELSRLGFRHGAWGEWSRRWTAEEVRHAAVIRDYVLVTRALDPMRLEQDRMHAMSAGFDAAEMSLLEGVIYAAVQELATRTAHRNTGRLLGDPNGREIMARIAGDEHRHFLFYRDLVDALLAAYPSEVVKALHVRLPAFRMPGHMIRHFRAHAIAIAGAGIYDMDIHYRDTVAPLVLQHWRIDSVQGLSPEADQAREQIFGHLLRMDRVARRVRENKQGPRPSRDAGRAVRRGVVTAEPSPRK